MAFLGGGVGWGNNVQYTLAHILDATLQMSSVPLRASSLALLVPLEQILDAKPQHAVFALQENISCVQNVVKHRA